ncbi:MAG: bifunctional adenosylcobinamide kinase/adenosylcobinamide-phosphate guanylyltransferase [Acidimicrobiia bacterium]
MITLVLGGVRSGKSEAAERLAGTGPVTYIATGAAVDAESHDRIARHRARRPSTWSTLEETDAVPDALRSTVGTVLLDALGSWLAHDVEGADIDDLVAALKGRDGDTVVVSDEVGLGVHPLTALGRRFADRLGEANQRVAEVADRCLLAVAGRLVELPGPSGGRIEDPAKPAVPLAVAASRTPGKSQGGLREAISFLTAVGRRAGGPPSAAAVAWFPAVGAGAGLALGGLWAIVARLLPPIPAGAVVTAFDLALTGGLHLDGLADSADGLLPALSPERRLGAMADPAIGAFGAAAVALVVTTRAVALGSFPRPRPLLLATLWSASRASMVLAMRRLPYARPGGIVSAFLDHREVAPPWRDAALVLIPAALAGRSGLAPLVGATCSAGAVHLLARRRIGGFTGDTLGAAGILAETAGLLAALAATRPRASRPISRRQSLPAGKVS